VRGGRGGSTLRGGAYRTLFVLRRLARRLCGEMEPMRRDDDVGNPESRPTLAVGQTVFQSKTPSRHYQKYSVVSDTGVRAALRSSIAICCVLGLFGLFPALSAAAPPKALILGSSISPGSANDPSGVSLEEQQAAQAGFAVTVVSDADWQSMTATQFAAYRLLIVGDPTCLGGDNAAGAEPNAATWERVVMASSGNKVLIGTDPTYHYADGSAPNAPVLERDGMAFAGAVPGATGLYLDLSCTFDGASSGTPVPILDGLSRFGPRRFSVTGEGPLNACATDVNVVGQSGPTKSLSDADLSQWNCSVHEAFDHFPADYTPLAIAPQSSGFPNSYCARDLTNPGPTLSCGAPYLLASGSSIAVSSNITLTPPSIKVLVGSTIQLTARVAKIVVLGQPPTKVSSAVVSGPNAGLTRAGTTDTAGQVPFSYKGRLVAGTDAVTASFTDHQGNLEQANATVMWVKPRCPKGPATSVLRAFKNAVCALAPGIRVAECAVEIVNPLTKTKAGLKVLKLMVKYHVFPSLGAAKIYADHHSLARDIALNLPDLLQRKRLAPTRVAEILQDIARVAGFGACVDVLAAMSS
jgi:hypothetical protein